MSVIGQLRDQALDLLLRRFEAQGAQGNAKVLQRDVTVGIRVEQVESLLDVSLLLVGELLAELAAGLLASGGGA